MKKRIKSLKVMKKRMKLINKMTKPETWNTQENPRVSAVIFVAISFTLVMACIGT